MMDRIKWITVFLLIMALSACYRNIDKLEKIKDSLVKSSLYSRHDYYAFHLYYKDREEIYFFEHLNGEFNLIRDTTEYKEVIGKYYIGDQLPVSSVKDSLNRIFKLIKDNGISGYRTDWRFGGIDLKLYMEDGSEVYYVSDTSKITSSWMNFIHDLEKVNDHWYIKE